jgi:hypothetical protein
VDVELDPRDIQGLNGPDAVAAFFARLGYNTDARIVQTPGNLGITESVARPINRLELLADQEGLFQIYLFELSSVTISNTRPLARAFRNLTGNFLLVLTSDYERLDFVLLEKYLPVNGDGGPSISQKQVGVRPRFLTVERRKPSRVDLRVLRRLTWTEADPFAQYEKLVSAYTIADWSEEFFNNRALFSDYYLLERLPVSSAWADDPKPSFARLRQLYQGATSQYAGQDKSTLRTNLLEPVLRELAFELKWGKKAGSGEIGPDYLLYSSEDKSSPLAFCLTYSWGRTLDGKDDQRDKETPEKNPGAVVVSLLEEGKAPWAIVTNGKLWRLYSQRAHSRATNYYEIDLEEVLVQSGPHAADPALSFRYFWLLFRRQAFESIQVVREGKETALPFLDQLLLESEDYAKRLGDRLKEKIFEEIFPHLAAGFIAHIREQDGADKDLTAELLDEVFKGTLTLLYRLLFLLYAESRDLLPVKEVRGYYEVSLTRLNHEIAGVAQNVVDEVEGRIKKHYREDTYELYEHLTKLFQVIDKGEVNLNVPFYNGGLFLTEPDSEDDSQEARAARFLNGARVPDRFLARALDLLSRAEDEKTHGLVFIDYKSLGVRQLGSIYEGLLEFKVRVADRKLAVVTEKGREVYKPFAELDERQRARAERQKRVLRKGQVYLENDKRERKATGSYYTPDYIVRYIVEHTVGPVLEEKFKAMRPRLREAQKWHREMQALARAKKESPGKYEFGPAVEQKWAQLVDELFDVKVLDPSMGSGHFLVEAVDYVTDKLLNFLSAFPWNPVVAQIAYMRQTILAEMEEQGITIDGKRLTDINLLKRHVLKRCIYGVDLNPMAVELAKVSLWLDCFTLGAPLSFLDHHLRSGNSLIGVTVQEVREAIEGKGLSVDATDVRSQFSLFGSRFAGLLLATDLMRHVGEMSDVTGAQVRQSRAEYGRAASALEPFKRILDIYTSQWFDDGVGPKKRKGATQPTAVKFLKSSEAEPVINANGEKELRRALGKLSAQDKAVAESALRAAEEKRFFHWELEFPEVFYGPRPGSRTEIERIEGGGFDAVVGNPPYISVTNIDETERPYYLRAFQTAEGRFDAYILFLEKGLFLLSAEGRLSFINPVKFCIYANGKRLRQMLLSEFKLETLLDISQCKDVFSEPSTYPCVLVVRNTSWDGERAIRIAKAADDSAEQFIRELSNNQKRWEGVAVEDILRRPDSIISPSLNSRVLSLLDRVQSASQTVGDFFDIEQCIRIGSPQARRRLVLSQKQVDDLPARERARCFPMLDGENLQRYEIIWNGNYLHYLSEELYNPKKPELLNRKKILIKRVAERLSCVYEQGLEGKPSYPLNTVYALMPNSNDAPDELFILALINSKLFNWLYTVQFEAISVRGGYVEYRENIKYLPVRRPEFPSSSSKRQERLKELVALYELCLGDGFKERGQPAAYNFAKLLERIKEASASASEYSEVLHDLLVYFANRMMELNVQKRAEIGRFLHSLDSELMLGKGGAASGVEMLTGQSSLHNYLGDYQKDEMHLAFEGLWNIIKANARRLGRPADANLAGEISKLYESSLSILLPIKQTLAATDWLIDRLVFDFYGLTEEETVWIKDQ